MENKTKGWFTLAMVLIFTPAVLYAGLVVFGVTTALSQAAAGAGPGIFLLLLIPASVIAGFGILIAKVILDRIGNKEDDYYSKNIHK